LAQCTVCNKAPELNAPELKAPEKTKCTAVNCARETRLRLMLGSGSGLRPTIEQTRAAHSLLPFIAVPLTF